MLIAAVNEQVIRYSLLLPMWPHVETLYQSCICAGGLPVPFHGSSGISTSEPHTSTWLSAG